MPDGWNSPNTNAALWEMCTVAVVGDALDACIRDADEL